MMFSVHVCYKISVFTCFILHFNDLLLYYVVLVGQGNRSNIHSLQLHRLLNVTVDVQNFIELNC